MAWDFKSVDEVVPQAAGKLVEAVRGFGLSIAANPSNGVVTFHAPNAMFGHHPVLGHNALS